MKRSPRRVGRWIATLVAVLCLHGIAGLWIGHSRIRFEPPEAPPPVQIALLKPERIERKPVSPTSPASPSVPLPAPERTPGRTRGEPALKAARPRSTPVTRTETPTSTANESAPNVAHEASGPAGSTGSSGLNGTGDASKDATTPGPQAQSGVKFSVPPSGDLEYDSYYNGMRNPSGTIRWHSDGHTYTLAIAIPLPFVGTYRYSSHGQIDAFGLAPEQYIEQRGRSAENVTIFNRDERQIVFTRTPMRLALPEGAQDRFSMLMQLAGLVRGNPDAYVPGVTREFFVTDSNSGETWPIQTIGDETVHTAEGLISARHFRRLPRRAGDTRRIDIWLAPSLGWLPARLMQTEPNGAEIELVWRGQRPPGSARTPSGPTPAAPENLYSKP
ncbi:DUF3108 domain-containing protein [Paraburkholderia hayleyella]|uniref:DUF3108 domain-containing protein n=1 Tax=Paraburkholderia hayleyella TaxID=2152889 RepID=UPI001FE7690E|nr:DUF3108 domain-containing protein [Paraburkholderia hayleyella]